MWLGTTCGSGSGAASRAVPIHRQWCQSVGCHLTSCCQRSLPYPLTFGPLADRSKLISSKTLPIARSPLERFSTIEPHRSDRALASQWHTKKLSRATLPQRHKEVGGCCGYSVEEMAAKNTKKMERASGVARGGREIDCEGTQRLATAANIVVAGGEIKRL